VNVMRAAPSRRDGELSEAGRTLDPE
jgi:hypothetical protein